jgi:hypothetical protein
VADSKRKGARRERQTRDWYIDHFAGACRIVKSGGSLGAADLLAVPLAGATELVLAQVKANRWPRPVERSALEQLAASLPDVVFPVVEIVRWDDYSRTGPTRARWTPEGWRAMRGDRLGELLILPQERPGRASPESRLRDVSRGGKMRGARE